ncbi:MAG: RHS repeat-associated core domain-containing protein, partial [Verrucomicrobiota bacterium]
SYQASYPSWFDDQPLVETFGGPLAGYEIRRNYDAETGEAVRVELRKNGQPVHAVDYGRDVVGRFSTVAASGATAFQAEYTYPSDLEEKLTWPGGNTLRTLAGDGTGTLGSIATITDAGENYSASYSFTGTRRTGAEISIHGLGIANWDYVFANLATGTGSLQSAVLNNAPRFSYAQNAAGNRVSGAANIANQYAIAAQPGARFYTVEGSVKPGATVKISRTGGPTVDVPTAADGSFAARLPVPEDGTNPVKIPLTVTGTLPGAGDDGTDAIADDKRTIVLTPAEMPIIYGVHGSLASDWRWNYHWDIEGRLAGMDTNPAARNAGMPNLTLRFSYDDLGRRIGKSAVYRKRVGTALVVTRTVTSSYVYDNWKLIAEEINDSTTSGPVTRYYTWGKDIAGSLDETGGVGGLLAIHENGGTYVPVYDGSGNIVALTDAQTGAQLAAWQRGPFGEPLEKRGDTSLCSFGFATHFTDEETGLVYFGHRYYSPTTGRWLSREPLGETESFNLYDYSHGDPVNKVDRLGLATVMIDGKASSTVESLWEEVTDTVRSTPASTVARAGVPPDLIRLAVTAAYMDATRPPPPPGNWSADSSIDMWALNASVREIDAARMSGKFDKRTNEMLKRISQAKSRAVIDVQLIEGTTNGLLFMTQPETAVLKAGGLLLGAAKGISAAGKFARAGDDVVGVAAKNVFWSGGRVAEDAARNFANAKNGIIIGDTAAGRTLAQATQGLPWSQARPQWLSLSEDFARCASGEVNVFQNARGLSLDSIWRSEYKILRQNSDVTGINYHIVMPDGSVSEFR